MKQAIFLMLLIAAAGVGSFQSPFWGVLLYYFFAVLRPQYLWEWSLPADVRWSLMAAGVAFFSVMLFAPRIMLRARLNKIAWLTLAFTLVMGLSVLTAHDPDVAQEWAVEFVKIVAMMMLATLVIEHIWQINAMGLMMLLALGYGAYEINYNYFINGRLDIFHVGFGGLDNNGAGLMIAMGVPFAYVFGVTSRRLWMRAASWGLGLFMLHAVLMSYSRGAMLATIVGAVWLLYHHRPRWQAGLIALTLCLCISVLAGKEIRERFFSAQSYEDDNSAQSRFDSWGAAWKIAIDHPILGVGVRNSALYSERYGADRHGRTIHSQFLQIAADSGLIAMTMYIALLLICFHAFGRSRGLCRAQLDATPATGPPDDARRGLILTEHLALGCQTSLLIFAFGGLFLSLEVFELPWLLIMLAGVFPAAVEAACKQMRERVETKPEPETAQPRPRRAKRRRLTPPLPRRGLA
ncbi:MAG: O-antigen ligase family protein [Planctomycetes bacterium]|nr:O-antigen ligase family protein [Planctomycetota bacterium]